ncbi:unnamed protein product [Ilex paraguariensis]|uniref:BZIP domain-containing protein n=1 Tax=Ilex paraguariensis TaxID=185542 RepID=A0ABC8USU8_9AQUA
MMSTFPAMLPSDGLFTIPFPPFESGFTPWDCEEPSFDFLQQQEPAVFPNQKQEPVISNSGSDNSNPSPLSPNYDSYEPNRNKEKSSSGSDEPNPAVPVIDERKRRRMISNRESARRSRMRKQKHLENLRTQVNRHKIGNRELMNRVRLITHHCQLVQNENVRLRSEAVMLRQKLWDMRQVLLVRQLQQQLSSSAWPCNNSFTPINEQTPQSLIT